MKIIIDISEFNNQHNRVRRQQKFYSLHKLYKQIRRFEQRPFVVNASSRCCYGTATYTGHILKFVITDRVSHFPHRMFKWLNIID